MPDQKRRTNPLLLLIGILLCIGSLAVFSQPTSNPTLAEQGTITLFASRRDSESAQDSPKTSEQNPFTEENQETQAELSVSPTATPTPVPTATISPEAASGVWTSSGSYWMFMVNGVPHTGWLTDTDGKRYFFNQDGIMQTGWIDYEGKRYYMDLDGIMQTGIITEGGKSYELLADGSLKDYQPPTPSPSPENTPVGTTVPAEPTTAPA